MDESVDSYAADLKKLLGQSGHTVASDGKDRILVELFIVGLPGQYAHEVRMNCRGNAIRDHVEYVHRLRSADQANVGDVSAVTTVPSNADHPRLVLCFSCRHLGHIARFCPKRTPARWGNIPICHFCDAVGHVKRDCQKREEWLKSQNKSSTITSHQTAQVLRMSLVEAWIHVVTWSLAHQRVEAPSLAFMRTFAVLVGLHVSWQRWTPAHHATGFLSSLLPALVLLFR